MTMRLNPVYAAGLVEQCTCELFPEWKAVLHTSPQGGDPYLQIHGKSPCAKSGEVVEWTGYKFRVSWHMTKTELICTVFKAYQQAIDHELRELFKFNGLQIFDPHRSLEAMCAAAAADLIEVRSNQLAGA